MNTDFEQILDNETYKMKDFSQKYQFLKSYWQKIISKQPNFRLIDAIDMMTVFEAMHSKKTSNKGKHPGSKKIKNKSKKKK